ncbi:type 1 glutamine amidotransferase domain-containing protein [Elizabethkingia anophelis]|uniref:type 1 glutamine amidotransferase domain-containing protein n=1 Tax=Elizabethkingia anophelis TaxID=1117645 RepID=UPI0009950F8E|nr:type 1 glutamine amidotransferase domain-containing protein [Elizabethkingia anophelis]AQW95598.1 protease I [Elizabethkingia anophelis]MCT4285397.1 type 1 glutamine amidotransferase domain-containing protein [Elizabethkingia anophelis]MDV3547557.1 type 1 glutamine amidotransferase domain-containing protein [Elizabethkingia anophelis]MDV3563253.1 type 1 glutamine amidotransferase domain-containing protein [Elizabethkingia anophelis]MDV3625051.1 type 1 glutamine amidotransferase domain-conta
MKKLLLVVTNIGMYESGKLKTGLWLSEITHIYHSAKEQNWNITIASPKGGLTPIDPESLKPLVLDKISKQYYESEIFMTALEHSKSLSEISEETFDCIYLAGGHATMYDFPDNITLQQLIRDQYEQNKIVAAICHGVGGLLNVKLSNGEYLIKGKSLTGFDWFEETLARRKREVPFNLEAALKERGADLKKACIPMTSNVVVTGNLITGQNPFSSKEMAKVVIEQLGK